MRRRDFMVLSTLAAASALVSRTALAATGSYDLRGAARAMWTYGLSLIEMAAQRNKTGGRGGAFNHRRPLLGVADRGVTAPNNDTLYSSAFIDLSGGPVTLTLPPTGDRYFSLALMDMWTDNFAVLGTRTTGGEGGTFVVVGPDQAAPPRAIRSPTNWIWALGRTLVSGEADLAAAHAIQDGLKIAGGKAGATPGPFADRRAPWDQYFASVQRLIDENAPPATDEALFHKAARLGVGPGRTFDPTRFSPAEIAQIQQGVEEAHTDLRTLRHAQTVNGWSYPAEGLGDFGQDYAYRATVALSGLAALPRAEAMYMQAVGPTGDEVLTDSGPHRLHFPADRLPPVDAFWSLTMYEVTPERQFFFTKNALERYSIGDRTPGLKYGRDGSLDIWISRANPGPDRESNWLPMPASGPYRMSMRAYLPKADLIEGRYRLPALIKA